MRAFQAWVLTAVCFLTLNLCSEWFARFVLERSKTLGQAECAAIRMLVLGIVFAIAANLVRPGLLKWLRSVHGQVKPGRGAIAGVIGALLLLGAVYLGYYFTYPVVRP